ncbi:MAG: hypothetical protein AAGI30_14325 [Planctomycetota bacterium]
MNATRLCLALLVVATGALGGCRFFGRAPSDYAVGFPLGAAQAGDVDVQVIRADTRLRFVNTSENVLPGGRLWVNKAFSRPVEPLGVGQSADYNLYQFRNRFDEPFRAGGFFATETPLDVVMVQLQPDDTTKLIGFRVVQGEPELR